MVEQLREREVYPSAELYKIDGIVGMYYSCGVKTDKIVVYGIGAPIPPDAGNLPDAPVIRSFGYDVFVPDYIGYGRSDGVFTPENCIKTFTLLFDQFTKGCQAKNSYAGKSRNFKYERIAMIGRSLGGTYVPILPRFDQRIKDLAIVCPVVDNKSCGSIPGEETNDDFMKAMSDDGYHYLYRGILDPLWTKHLNGEDDLSPLDNINSLSEARLFIGHGVKDSIVHYSKSLEYYEQIVKAFPDNKGQFKLQLYEEGRHDKTTTNPAVVDFLSWINTDDRKDLK